jgi:hypothetical protein
MAFLPKNKIHNFGFYLHDFMINNLKNTKLNQSLQLHVQGYSHLNLKTRSCKNIVHIHTLIFFLTKVIVEISAVNLLQTSQMSSKASGRPPLYPRRQVESLTLKYSRKRKDEDVPTMAAKCPRLCRNKKRNLEQNQATFVPFKRTRLAKDREAILFGIQVLDSLDAHDIVHH